MNKFLNSQKMIFKSTINIARCSALLFTRGIVIKTADQNKKTILNFAEDMEQLELS